MAHWLKIGLLDDMIIKQIAEGEQLKFSPPPIRIA
jgi:hypothetical protein